MAVTIHGRPGNKQLVAMGQLKNLVLIVFFYKFFLKYKYQLRKGKKWYVFLFLFFEKKIQAQCESVA